MGDDGFDDDWDDEDASFDASLEKAFAEHTDTLSRKSSTTTLASRTSKRAYEEVELDDFDDDEVEPTSQGMSPHPLLC